MKRLIAFMLIAVVVIVGLFALSNNQSPLSETDIQTVQLANRLYNKADYDGAVELYQDLIDRGVQTVEVYYNLGNTVYQLGDYNDAVLNFSRAQQLDPRDANIQHNLQLAQESAGVTDLNQTSLITRLQNVPFTLNELALMALTSAFVVVIMWQARRFIKSPSWKRIATFAFVLTMIWFAGSGWLLGSRLS